MLNPEIQKNIDYIRNLKIVRNYDQDESQVIKEYFKKKLNLCFGLLKYIQQRDDTLQLKEEYDEVMKLAKEIENTYKEWFKK